MKKKHLWIAALLILVSFLAIPVFHILKTKWREDAPAAAIPKGYANDASQLNLTKVDTVVQVPSGKKEMERQLRDILKYARANQLKISIAGARHSMGGHTIYRNGVVLNMLPYQQMKLDTVNNMLTIGAGALWEDAIKYLDKYGKSIAIMQSFSSFSIGGSVSVNGHGWQKDSPPISASVVSFTLMKANGEIINCSRQENAELFHLVLGGYGLFGIILEVKLKVVDNNVLKFKYIRLSPENYVNYYKKYVSANPNVHMAL